MKLLDTLTRYRDTLAQRMETAIAAAEIRGGLDSLCDLHTALTELRRLAGRHGEIRGAIEDLADETDPGATRRALALVVAYRTDIAGGMGPRADALGTWAMGQLEEVAA